MASEMDLLSFLKVRNIPDNIINKLKDDKIDISIIDVMTDEQLGQYIVRYGGRLALRAFCRQRTVTNKTSGEATVKFGLMQKVRDRLGEQRKTPFSSVISGQGAGNK